MNRPMDELDRMIFDAIERTVKTLAEQASLADDHNALPPEAWVVDYAAICSATRASGSVRFSPVTRGDSVLPSEGA